MTETGPVGRRQTWKQPTWLAFVVILVAVLLMSGLNVAYTRKVDHDREVAERESDRRWCELLVTLDSAYARTPPNTDLGRSVASAVHNLRTSLNC